MSSTLVDPVTAPPAPLARFSVPHGTPGFKLQRIDAFSHYCWLYGIGAMAQITSSLLHGEISGGTSPPSTGTLLAWTVGSIIQIKTSVLMRYRSRRSPQRAKVCKYSYA